MYCRDQRNQAFKDCSGVIRLVIISVLHLGYAKYVVTLRLVSLVQGKPMKICLLSFSMCFTWQESKDINIESNIFARCAILRHEWCFIREPVEGTLRLPLRSCLKGVTRMAKHAEFPPWYPCASVSGPFTVTQISGGFFWKRRGSRTQAPPPSLLRFAASSLLTAVVLLKWRQ